MNTLDDLYKKCFVINENIEIEDYDNGLSIIRNVFKYPELVLKFQTLLSKWDSCNNAKPGLMSLELPYWTVKYAFKQIFGSDFDCDWQSCKTEFIYFYWNNTAKDAPKEDLRSNNCLLPHTDSWLDEEILISLVNLNHRPVKTAFWKFDEKSYEHLPPDESEYSKYYKIITEENIDVVLKEGRLEKEFQIQYNFNEGIIYPANRYHQPIIDKFYTRENPRILLRYSLRNQFYD